jgi:hypothetical protein
MYENTILLSQKIKNIRQLCMHMHFCMSTSISTRVHTFPKVCTVKQQLMPSALQQKKTLPRSTSN